MVGQIYFLINATRGESKNPNELYSFLFLAIFLDVIFLIVYISLAIDVKRNWIDKDPTDDHTLEKLIQTLWVLAFILICLTVIIVALIGLTIQPLRERILEEVFWEIGANMNLVENHKAKTLYIAFCKVDFIVHLLFINTFAFLCYYFTDTNKLKVWPYWTLFSVITILSISTTIHSQFIMRTTSGTLNSKCYFIMRTLL